MNLDRKVINALVLAAIVFFMRQDFVLSLVVGGASYGLGMVG
jgi:hypothetical protein